MAVLVNSDLYEIDVIEQPNVAPCDICDADARFHLVWSFSCRFHDKEGVMVKLLCFAHLLEWISMQEIAGLCCDATLDDPPNGVPNLPEVH